MLVVFAENIQTETKEEKQEVICIVGTNKEIWLVQTNQIGNSLEERKKKETNY